MKPGLKSKKVILNVALLVFAFGCGCAHRPLNDDVVISYIRNAQEAGANDVPRASVHLNLAKKELEIARGLSDSGQFDQADSMLMRAKADGEMALALSREAIEKLASADARERVTKVKKSMNENEKSEHRKD